MPLLLELRNVSGRNAHITFGPQGSFYDFYVTDQHGKRLPNLPRTDNGWLTVNAEGDVVALGKSNFTLYDLGKFARITRPGVYTVTAVTRLIFDPLSHAKLNLASNTIRIVVLK